MLTGVLVIGVTGFTVSSSARAARDRQAMSRFEGSVSRKTVMAGAQGAVESGACCHRHGPAAAARAAPTLNDLGDDTMDTLAADTARPRSEHLTALGLAAGTVVALGFTRFAYALLLPSIRTELGWSYAAAGVRQPRTSALRAPLDHVTANPAVDDTLDSHARYVGISTRHLTRLLRAETGTSPARFVEQVRLEAACTLLVTGTDSLDAVARQAGFGSPETMRRVFQRELGVTPGAYRARFSTTAASSHQRLASTAP
jgi:AraC-like DNA-binding protein